MNVLYKELQKFGKVKINEPLAKHTTFKIGGPADFLVIIDSVEQLPTLFRYLDSEGVPYVVFGGGSNMLVSDAGFRGVVIKIMAKVARVEGDIIIADAGCLTVALAQLSIKEGLTGFEWGVGVPGTIGGAVRGNAGAMGGETKTAVEKIELYRDGEIIELSSKECEFGYRTSGIKEHGGVILRVYLKLSKTEDKTGMKKALEHLQYRNKTQPQGYASTGCIFKNVDIHTGEQGAKNRAQLLAQFDEQNEKIQQFLRVGKISAGWLVEQAGLKGREVGKARVSETHGNFVMNMGGATATEVLKLIEEIKTAVYNKVKIPLEEEIQIIQ